MAVITQPADATTLTLDGYIVNDFAAGDFIEFASENDLTSRVNSRNGGVNIQERVDGGVTNVTIRVQKLSESDIKLNTWRNQKEVKVFDGSSKTNFTSNGIDGVESYSLESGSLTTQPTDTKNNQDGNAMMEYVIQFRNGIRNL